MRAASSCRRPDRSPNPRARLRRLPSRARGLFAAEMASTSARAVLDHEVGHGAGDAAVVEEYGRARPRSRGCGERRRAGDTPRRGRSGWCAARGECEEVAGARGGIDGRVEPSPAESSAATRRPAGARRRRPARVRTNCARVMVMPAPTLPATPAVPDDSPAATDRSHIRRFPLQACGSDAFRSGLSLSEGRICRIEDVGASGIAFALRRQNRSGDAE